MALTAKQERFVQEFPIELYTTQAAIQAGYNEKTDAEPRRSPVSSIRCPCRSTKR